MPPTEEAVTKLLAIRGLASLAADKAGIHWLAAPAGTLPTHSLASAPSFCHRLQGAAKGCGLSLNSLSRRLRRTLPEVGTAALRDEPTKLLRSAEAIVPVQISDFETRKAES
jgi:hypothetical protein